MRQTFKYCKKWLRKNFPSEYPFRVTLVGQDTISRYRRESNDYDKEVELDGYCLCYANKKHKYKFNILIDKTISEHQKIITLLHEHAHLLQMHLAAAKHIKHDGHDDIFETFHGKILRMWHGEDR